MKKQVSEEVLYGCFENQATRYKKRLIRAVLQGVDGEEILSSAFQTGEQKISGINPTSTWQLVLTGFFAG